MASGVDVSAIGIGTMSWGDASLGFGNSYRERDLVEAMKRAVDRGVTFVDTAEVYGVKSSTYEQSAEHIVGRTAAEAREVAAVRILQGLLRARGEAAYAPGAQAEEG